MTVSLFHEWQNSCSYQTFKKILIINYNCFISQPWELYFPDIVCVTFNVINILLFLFYGSRQLVYPGQLVEVEQNLEEVQPGMYKSKLLAKMVPGRNLTVDTFLITRVEEHVFSYGYSKTIRLDTWSTPLR